MLGRGRGDSQRRGKENKTGNADRASAKGSVFPPPQTIVAQKHQMSPLVLPKEELFGEGENTNSSGHCSGPFRTPASIYWSLPPTHEALLLNARRFLASKSQGQKSEEEGSWKQRTNPGLHPVPDSSFSCWSYNFRPLISSLCLFHHPLLPGGFSGSNSAA